MDPIDKRLGGKCNPHWEKGDGVLGTTGLTENSMSSLAYAPHPEIREERIRPDGSAGNMLAQQA